MAQLQQDHPPAAARRRGGGLAGACLHRAHARHDQVLAVEDVVPGTAHQGHDGRRGHQAVEVRVYSDSRRFFKRLLYTSGILVLCTTYHNRWFFIIYYYSGQRIE